MTAPTPLPWLSVIEASGEDALDFLHGQFCGDLKGLAPGRSLLTAWCSPKGRVLATLLVIPRPTGCLLVLPAETAAGVLKRLSLFVLRARVTLAARDDVGAAGCAGPAAPSAGLAEPWQVAEQNGRTMVALPGVGRFRLLLLGHLQDREDGVCGASLDAGAWALEDVETGLPWVLPAAADEFLPQELGLEALGGLSYRKGCYPGQEVIARVHYRGRLKRHLRRLTAPAPLAPGARLVDAEGRAAGCVVSAAARGDGAWRALAAVEEGAGSLRADEAAGGAAVALD